MPVQRGGGWKVTGAGAEFHVSRQCDAIDEACSQLRHGGGGAVVIHGITGKVQDRRTV
ncbi:DUF2188 domain-containing protein [Saccharopolyspora mangrovi]|uniref:DUF2188 domain-containing protein n=1 Tax=Saccharopolyspora mangrovi TaxID=3082379 RepID=A0ABU6A4V4_9PSEU|nr:DUF2188 domain-containing protein [Saccharopolyspora sp. S2-29]MEB3366511.1 DUF2188 domain-containing protein [Saccharopolyspora sp. S2-29]